MNKFLRQFSVIFNTDEPRISAGRTIYAFRGVTVLGSSVVGLVDCEGVFGETLGRGSAHGFTGNGVLNPPNPPGTRACADDESLFREREEIDGNLDEEFDL